jgi:hypothetical protein
LIFKKPEVENLVSVSLYGKLGKRGIRREKENVKSRIEVGLGGEGNLFDHRKRGREAMRINWDQAKVQIVSIGYSTARQKLPLFLHLKL